MFSQINRIDERIERLLDGRTASHMAQRCSFNKNWVQLFKKGQGRTVLLPLSSTENVSVDWLLYGVGQPYRVNHWQTAQQMQDAVAAFLDQPSQTMVYLVGDGLVVWTYSSFQDDDNPPVAYVSYEAHFGPINTALAKRLTDSGLLVQTANLGEDLTRLKAGQIGTYQLFGYVMEEPFGLLAERRNHPRASDEQIRAMIDTDREDNTVRFDVLAAQPSMGYGAVLADENDHVLSTFEISREYIVARLASATNISNIKIVTGIGDSMEGTLHNGDLLFVDTGVSEVGAEAIYAMRYHEGLLVKRVQRISGGQYKLISDNAAHYEPIIVDETEKDTFQVIGRVIDALNITEV